MGYLESVRRSNCNIPCCTGAALVEQIASMAHKLHSYQTDLHFMMGACPYALQKSL